MLLSEDLKWRGLIKDTTFQSSGWLDEPKSFYLGLDPSANSLTIGNLAILMLVLRLSSYGWKPVLVMGGGTSMVGDPGGKTTERQLMSRSLIRDNVKGIRAQVARIFQGKDFQLVDNYDWLSRLKYLDVLREIGKHFTMTELMQRDFVETRLGKEGTGISYAEFSYSIIQGYDYWYLFKNYQVVLQIGGSDQWGNLLSGVSLIRKKENAEVHALSMPLVIDKSTGRKFGKSEGGAVWLDPNKTSPFAFYQFWLNVVDDSALDFLKIYTLLSKTRIEQIMKQFSADKKSRLAQKTLAYEVTQLVHGEVTVASVQKATDALFGDVNFHSLGAAEVEILRSELPLVKSSPNLAITLASAGLASSASDARRLIASGAVNLNGQKVASADYVFQSGLNLLKVGKNKFAIVEN